MQRLANKNKTLISNQIYYEECLRYLEDEIFIWDLLAVTKKLVGIRKQHYVYNVNPNLSSGVVQGLNLNFDINKFKIIKTHIQNSFKSRGCLDQKLKN